MRQVIHFPGVRPFGEAQPSEVLEKKPQKKWRALGDDFGTLGAILSVIPLNTLSVSNDLVGPIDPPPAPLKDEDRNGVNADDHRRNSDKTSVRE